MEEILKSLQGKSITKKSLFDFLSEINLEDISIAKPNSTIYENIVIHPIKEAQPQEKKRRGRKPKEKPLVEQLQKGIHVIVDELLETAITDTNKLECKFCKYIFSTKGNLHKHFNTSVLCNNMAYDAFKKVVINFNT